MAPPFGLFTQLTDDYLLLYNHNDVQYASLLRTNQLFITLSRIMV